MAGARFWHNPTICVEWMYVVYLMVQLERSRQQVTVDDAKPR